MMTKIKRLTLTIPPLRGPDPQGLNVPFKQVKTVINSEKINGRQRQYRQGSTERRPRSRITLRRHRCRGRTEGN